MGNRKLPLLLLLMATLARAVPQSCLDQAAAGRRRLTQGQQKIVGGTEVHLLHPPAPPHHLQLAPSYFVFPQPQRLSISSFPLWSNY